MSRSLFPGRRVMWMAAEWKPPGAATPLCCVNMRHALQFECDQHESPFDCPDTLVIYNEPFDEYGLIVHDGGPSYVLVSFCPWCGTGLPESQRDRWFDETEALDDPENPPQKYQTAEWRRAR